MPKVPVLLSQQSLAYCTIAYTIDTSRKEILEIKKDNKLVLLERKKGEYIVCN